MAERRTYQGHVYTRNSPDEPWVIAGPATGGAIIADPYKANDERRKDEDQRSEAERLRIAREAADRADRAEARAAEAEARAAREWAAKHNPDGSLKPVAGAGALTPEERGKQLAQYNSLPNLIDGVNDLRRQYDKNFKGWNPLEAIDTMPGGQVFGDKGRIFNDTSNSLTAYIAMALGLSGQQFNTPAEQKLFIEGILPKAGDTDGQITAKLDRLDRLIGNARDKGKATLGYTDDNDPLAASAGLAEFLKRSGGGGDVPPPPPSAAPPGSTERSVPMPPEMQAENQAWLAQNMRTMDGAAYVQFRKALDAKYGFGSAPDAELRSWAENARGSTQKGASVPTAIPPATQQMSGMEQARNDAVQSPFGAFTASMANAGGLGIPGLLAGDQMDALRDASPLSTTIGDIAGSITGTAGVAKGLGMVAGKVASPSVAALLSNPVFADVAYGTTYGATQADNPLTGALAGGGFALGGSLLGSQFGKRAPGAFGLRKAVDPLAPGERNVIDAVAPDKDSVVAALQNAGELGVPAAIADVSGPANTLAGAALRRSPDAAASVREALAQRGRGQIDRFRGAVERDLGPIENVPQRSEDLITQARAAAGPLYDQAYAAPGAGAIYPSIEDLLARPSMGPALGSARRIAAEEGRDPTSLGFDLDIEGNPVLTRVPSWQTIDYTKRGLDNVLEGYPQNPITGKLILDTEGRAIDATRREFLSRVDAVNPDYASARSAYAGPAREREYLQAGQRAVTATPDQLGVDVTNMSPLQIEQARLGFQSGLVEKADRLRYGTNPFEATLGTPAMEQRLGTLYEQPNVARLLAQRDLEREVAGSTNRLIGNSMTAERQVADQAFEQNTVLGDVVQGAVETAVTGAPVVTAARSRLGRDLGQKVRDYRSMGLGLKGIERANQIADLALDTDSGAAVARLLALTEKSDEYKAVVEALMRSGAIRGGHVMSGAAVGSGVAATR